jgi:membrane protease YdiL (CAAX protease family)
LNGAVAWEYAFGWLLVFFFVGLFEESLLRGYLQNRLAGSVGFLWAAIGLSLAFSLLHLNNRGESVLGLLTLVAAGLAFCLSLWYTKSLWWAIGFHTGWDWGESYIYGTPNSGMIMEGHLFTVYQQGIRFGAAAAPDPKPACSCSRFSFWLV